MLKRFFILRSPDDGTGAPPATPAPAGDAPPAASVVVDATITEDTLQLREENERLKKRVKDVETEAAGLQDENFRLKKAGAIPPQPDPKPDTRSALEKFMAGEDV